MNLTHYIIEFLEKYHRVTIPSFGKLELEFQPAFFQHEIHQITPPKYHLSFSQQHNLDDLSLLKEIAKSEAKRQKDIELQIEQEIAQWKQTLKKEKSLTLNRLGTFHGEKEKISFQPVEDCFCYDYYFGLPVIDLTLNN